MMNDKDLILKEALDELDTYESVEDMENDFCTDIVLNGELGEYPEDDEEDESIF